MKDNTNRDAVLTAIWNNPAPLMGGEWRPATGGAAWEYIRGGEWGNNRGAVRLLRSRGAVGVRVFFNHGTGRTSEQPDIFEYIQNRDSLAGFAETLQQIAGVYGIKLELSAEERTAITRRELARNVAASLIDSLRLNPDGETARYIREQRRFKIDGVHFGELTAESLKKAKESLTARGIKYDAADFEALGLTEARAKSGYNCVIPHYQNGNVCGFALRNIRQECKGPKYLKSEGMGRPGYCDRLTPGEPAVFVEGELDAVRLIQEGIKNVVGIGGPVIGEDIARIIRANGINEVVYIPDAENDANGRRKLKVAREAVRKFSAAEVEGEPVIKSLLVLDLPAPVGPGAKTDADKFGAENPGELAQMLALAPAQAWAWELDALRAEAATDEADGRRVDVGTLHERTTEIYGRVRNPYARQQLRDYVARCKDLAAYGITPAALEDIDAFGERKAYIEKIKHAAAALNKAVEEKAGPDVIGEISREIAEAQSLNARAAWDAQLEEPFDAELEALRIQPDTLQTGWQLGTVDKFGNYHEGEPVEFFPADISVFCAATSHGKTAVLFSAAFELLEQYPNKTFLFVSCEENKRQLLQRAFSVFSNIPTTDSGKDENKNVCFRTRCRKRTIKAILTDGPAPKIYTDGEFMGRSDDYETLKEAFKKDINEYGRTCWPRLKFVHTDASAESITANIENYVAKIQAAGGEVGAVFLDYVQLLTSEARTFSRHDELKDICKALHECAGRIEIPVIVAAQLNREVLRPAAGGGGTPLDNITVSNIGEGADIERIAHDVYLVWQVDKTPAGWYMSAAKEKPAPAPDDYKIGGGFRLNRLFSRGLVGESGGRELKTGYLYIEQLKGRDGITGGWGLFPFDGERGKISKNDTKKMCE